MHMLVGWRARILEEFTPNVAHLTLVADPDGLLLEETLLAAINGRGFDLFSLDDPVAFRFAHESRFRSSWDGGEGTNKEVVLRTDRHDLATLPHDLLQAGRRLSFGLAGLFPGFSYPVVASLDRSDLDALYSAQAVREQDDLGDDATKDFVLLHVFEIVPDLIRDPSSLLRVLLRKHYRGQLVPRILDNRLVHLLRRNGICDCWPLETIVPDREAFFSFLQERWPIFLNRFAGMPRSGRGDTGGPPAPEGGDPLELPFDHDDVRVYVDNLFVEGMLKPVPHGSGDAMAGDWVSVGISTNPLADQLHRLDKLIKAVEATIPDAESRHQDWVAFAYRWAELGRLRSRTVAAAPSELGLVIARLCSEVDSAFLTWMENRYSGLYNQPPSPPAMVHHVPRYLVPRLSNSSQSKIALIVIDGLALDQWIILRDVLLNQRPRLRLREGGVFAWVPTITTISRQAIFAGKLPFYFPSSFRGTDKESSLWTQFWVDQGLTAQNVSYAKGIGDRSLDHVSEILLRPETRALGLVVDKVDKIMHGMELGTTGMHNQVRQWAEEGLLARLLDALINAGFAVFLTSDHGNIEAEGRGRPGEGVIADLRGERARIYPDRTLRSRVKEQFPDAVEWPADGLPEECLALLATGRWAFVREGERIVGHGGISLEEVVVPMVEIERTAA